MALVSGRKIEITIGNYHFGWLLRHSEGYNFLRCLCSAKHFGTKFAKVRPIGFDEMQKIGVDEIIKETKFEPEESYEELYNFFRIHHFYRGIDIRDYDQFLLSGNTNTIENMELYEQKLLNSKGLKPKDVIYATTDLAKAWEYCYNKNPMILVIYKGDYFESVDIHGKPYLWKIKAGLNIKEAVAAHVVIWFK